MTTSQGIFNDRGIENLFASKAIEAQNPLLPKQVQPASLDLRLGAKAYRVRASFLPGKEKTVEQCLKEMTLHTLSLEEGAVLETGCVYIVPLQERLNLPDDVMATANPKSSTGRLDVFTRVITDRASSFDTIRAGYSGQLYMEISPRTFPILARSGSRLGQVRFRNGHSLLSDAELSVLNNSDHLTPGTQALINGGLHVSIDLSKELDTGIVGYRAKRHSAVLDIDRVEAYEKEDFFEPVPVPRNGALILDPGQFYILASREKVHIPPHVAAEMVAIDPLMGEFRVHYAGFFDPGFGHIAEGKHGSRAVLEVRSYDVPFVLEHGQPVARLVFERLLEMPQALYGSNGSNYQAQKLKLAKHFK